jgi:ribosomal protein S18 acetylase RimI-like enzyme
MFEVKKLPPDRWQDYRDLRLEALKSDPIAFSSSYEEELTLTKEIWQGRVRNALFALKNSELVGMVAIVLNDRVKTKHIAHIFSVYVKKEYRNQGIGTKLIARAIEYAEESKDISKIKVSVNPEQSFAMRLYEKMALKV